MSYVPITSLSMMTTLYGASSLILLKALVSLTLSMVGVRGTVLFTSSFMWKKEVWFRLAFGLTGYGIITMSPVCFPKRIMRERSYGTGWVCYKCLSGFIDVFNVL